MDDDADVREALSMFLIDEGYDVSIAAGGADALAVVATNPPDLVILDQHMPDMTGLEVVGHLNANPATAALPVLLFSAASARGESQVGRVMVLPKSAAPSMLLAAITAQLGRDR